MADPLSQADDEVRAAIEKILASFVDDSNEAETSASPLDRPRRRVLHIYHPSHQAEQLLEKFHCLALLIPCLWPYFFLCFPCIIYESIATRRALRGRVYVLTNREMLTIHLPYRIPGCGCCCGALPSQPPVPIPLNSLATVTVNERKVDGCGGCCSCAMDSVTVRTAARNATTTSNATGSSSNNGRLAVWYVENPQQVRSDIVQAMEQAKRQVVPSS